MAIGFRRLLVLLCSSAALLTSCRSNTGFSPSAVYLQAESKFQHGDLNGALAQVDDGLRELDGKRPDEAWRFRLLKAEVLIWQGFSQDAITLLRLEPPQT